MIPIVSGKYHAYAAPGLPAWRLWCSSFLGWCLHQGTGKDIYKSAASQCLFKSLCLSRTNLEKISKPFFGAIAIWSDYHYNKKYKKYVSSHGHISFYYGKASQHGKAIFLGGNQSHTIKLTKYDVSTLGKTPTKKARIFRGYYKPKGYNIKKCEYLVRKINLNSENKKILKTFVISSDNEEDGN